MVSIRAASVRVARRPPFARCASRFERFFVVDVAQKANCALRRLIADGGRHLAAPAASRRHRRLSQSCVHEGADCSRKARPQRDERAQLAAESIVKRARVAEADGNLAKAAIFEGEKLADHRHVVVRVAAGGWRLMSWCGSGDGGGWRRWRSKGDASSAQSLGKQVDEKKRCVDDTRKQQIDAMQR